MPAELERLAGNTLGKLAYDYWQDEGLYTQEYNLACEVAVLIDGETIELHDSEGMVAGYKVAAPTP